MEPNVPWSKRGQRIRMLWDCGTTTLLRLFTCLPPHELLPVCIIRFNSPFWLWKLSLRSTSCPPSTVRLVLLFVISVSMVLLLVCLVAHGSPTLRKLLKRSLSTFPSLEVVELFIPQWSWSAIRFLTCMDRLLSVPSVRDISCIKRLSSVVGSAKIDVHPSMLDNLVHDTRLQLSLALRLLYSFFFFGSHPFCTSYPLREGAKCCDRLAQYSVKTWFGFPYRRGWSSNHWCGFRDF